MNLSLLAALAFFFGLAAASLAVRIATADGRRQAKALSFPPKRPRAKAGLTEAS